MCLKFLSNKNKTMTIISSYVQRHKYQGNNFRISTVETVQFHVQLFCGINRDTTLPNCATNSMFQELH